MPDDNTSLEEQAKEWVRQNKRVIIDKFANLIDYPGVSNPFTMFMAGINPIIRVLPTTSF